MSDNYSHYTRLIKTYLGFHNSAPHHYWGLYFFKTWGLRRKCQLGHVMQRSVHFDLGRHAPKTFTRDTECAFEGWTAQWSPPPGRCDAAAIPGYHAMCPTVAAAPVRRH